MEGDQDESDHEEASDDDQNETDEDEAGHEEENDEAGDNETASTNSSVAHEDSEIVTPISVRLKEGATEQALFKPRRITKLKIAQNEAMQEMLVLLKDLHNPDLQSPLSQWVLKAINLSSTLCSPLGLVSESIHLSEICLSVLRPVADKNPETFQSLLAMNLMTCAEGLGKNGQL